MMIREHFDDLVQDCVNSSVNALELLPLSEPLLSKFYGVIWPYRDQNIDMHF